jgi:hypothetical protein
LSDTLKLTDFRMAGFLLTKDVQFRGTELEGSDVVFVFEDAGGIASATLDLYPGSAEQKYDAACKTMHDMVKIRKRSRRR